MSPTLTTPEASASLRQLIAEAHRRSLGRFLSTFAATPDDRLDFKPSETARSIRELAGHVIEGNGYVGQALGVDTGVREIATERAAVASQVERSTHSIVAAIESLSDDAINGSVEFFGTTMPMTAFLLTSDWHIARHTAQVDYVQTIYGDLEDHG